MVGMMSRNSTRARRVCFDAHKFVSPLTGKIVLQCHVCKREIDPVREEWRADHIRRHAEDGEESADNLRPICLACDGGKGGKAARDASEVAKGKRVRDRHYGIKARGWRRPDGVKFDWRKGRYVKGES